MGQTRLSDYTHTHTHTLRELLTETSVRVKAAGRNLCQ